MVVPPTVVAAPAPLAHFLEMGAGFARPVAMAAKTFDSAIEPHFGAFDAFTTIVVPDIPGLGASRRAYQ